MKMAVEPVGPGVVKVILDGRLDVAGSGIIDLQFSAIAGSHRGVGSFILLNPVEEVERVLEVMGMTDLMPVFHDADTALAAAAAQA
jgi:anti-anti-sigma regulatory factor